MIMITFILFRRCLAARGHPGGADPVPFRSRSGSTIALKAFAATIIGGFGDVARCIIGDWARH